jgi:ATP-dependent DNA helicase RecQ
LDRFPLYGGLRGTPQPRIRSLLRALEEADCLETVGTEYPTVRLTARGEAVHRGDPLPGLALDPEPPPAPRRRAGSTRAAPPPDGAPSSPETEAIFEDLRAWRLEQARARGVPAYVIFPDATLRCIAEERPRTDSELLAVKGVGPAKLEAYGAALLARLR